MYVSISFVVPKSWYIFLRWKHLLFLELVSLNEIVDYFHFFFPFSFFHNLLLWIGNLNWSSDVLLAFSKIFIYLFERHRDTQ